MKTILFDKECRDALMAGIDTLADAVSSTLGPKGRNVVVKHSYDVPFSTHDGVTVAKEVFVNDPVGQAGVEMVREAATKTNDLAGDGTTTATILARAIIKEGLKAIDKGANPQLLKSGIEQAAQKVMDRLKEMAIPVKTKEELLQIATISSASEELGKLVADAVELAGEDGIVTLNEVPTTEITIEKMQGLEIESGWMSQYFITDDKNNACVAKPYILVTDQRVGVGDLIKVLDLLPSKNFVLVCEDLDVDALQLLVLNKLDPQKQCHFLALRAPAYGKRRAEILGDLCTVTGAVFITQETGRSLSSVQLIDLGSAQRVESTQQTTLFIDGGGHSVDIEQRKTQLKGELSHTKELFDKDLLTKRIAKLSSGVVVINVGGKTTLEMREKKYRIEDAVNATRAAQAEGIVPGGETALFRASEGVNFGSTPFVERDGFNLLLLALQEPYKKLLENAGIEYALPNLDQGIDVKDGQIKNLTAAGIIDPVKVTRCALQNAASIAANVLTTQVVIVDIPDNVKD